MKHLPWGCSLWILVLTIFAIVDMGWFSLYFVGVFLILIIFLTFFDEGEETLMKLYGKRAVRNAKVKLKLIRKFKKFKRKSRFVKDEEMAMREYSLMNNIPYNIFSRWMDCVKDVKRKKLEPLVKDSVKYPNEIIIRYVDDTVKKREPSRKNGKAGTVRENRKMESPERRENVTENTGNAKESNIITIPCTVTITARESNNKNESRASDNQPMSEEEFRQEIKRLKEENERLKRKLKENK